MNINQYLEKHKNITVTKSGYEYRDNAPHILCADGFKMSVQVSNGHYCSPRINDAGYYDAVEVGYPNEREELLMEYAEEELHPTETVYGHVPARVVDAVIKKHGGFVSDGDVKTCKFCKTENIKTVSHCVSCGAVEFIR